MFLIHTSNQHAITLARAVVSACRGSNWQSPLQPQLLQTLFNSLLNLQLDFETLEPIAQSDVIAILKSPEERSELIQLMCAIEVLCNPVPEKMEKNIENWAKALDVEERSLEFLRDLALGETVRATHDFYRLNWIGDLDRRLPNFDALVAKAGDSAYATTVEEDPVLFAHWSQLGNCPVDSLGRRLFEFYQSRGFLLPGQAGAANESVAQHDWIHVLADYGTTPLGEIEVVAFMASCCKTPGTTLGLIGALALFESGAFDGSLIAKMHQHEGLSLPGGIDRMAEAIQRGKTCNSDLLNLDFFELATTALDTVRKHLAIPPKSDRILSLDPVGAGSPGFLE